MLSILVWMVVFVVFSMIGLFIISGGLVGYAALSDRRRQDIRLWLTIAILIICYKILLSN